MAPARLRHRIGIETLKRELQANSSSSSSSSNNNNNNHNHSARAGSTHTHAHAHSQSQTLTLEEHWAGHDLLSIDWGSRHESHQNGAVGDKIPGFRTSAAFLSSLGTNLRLYASPPPSPMSTPPSMRASASSLAGPPSPPLPPSAGGDLDANPAGLDSTAAADPLADVPELSSYLSSDAEEKLRALKLVADSVAQMRQTASRIIIFHPLNLAVYMAFLAVVSNYMYTSRGDNIGIVFTTDAGLVMAALVAVRWLTNPYILAAEDVNAHLLDGADVLVTKFGNEVIGAVVVGWEAAESRGKRRKWRAEIRGWAVRLRYRGKGVGLALLEDAVALAKTKGAENIEFAEDHANSKRILWSIYNGPFDRKEKMARAKLQHLWDASLKGKKR
ncbi:hypothetical protein MBLNU459_g1252t1 [Dothideomycetes sp. NU459]